jgi:quinol monooxygenase YgiN
MMTSDSDKPPGESPMDLRQSGQGRGNVDTTILVIITMEVLPEKRKEFLQALKAVMVATRKTKGWVSERMLRDVHHDNTFTLWWEWETEADFQRHLQSDLFSVLLGTATLLAKPLEVKINAVSYRAGMETIHRARGGRQGWKGKR